MNPLCYFNNAFVPYTDLTLHISDVGIQRAYSIFDFMVQHGDEIPFIGSYIDRFFNSAKLMQLQIPISGKEIEKNIYHLVETNHFRVSGIKLLLTGGYSVDGYTPGKPNFIILNTAFPAADPNQYLNGISVITCNYKRSLPEAKTTDYAISLTYFVAMQKAGASEILYTWNGNILEASRSNFFMLKNNILVTPDNNVLPGITRKEVIKLASAEHQIEERDIEYSELHTADSCFITSTTKGILPVVLVDNIKINNKQIHPVLKYLMKEFNRG